MDEDFQLGEWFVRPQRRIVECGEQSVHIKPKPMSVLQCLASANGEPVSRNDLFNAVWPGGIVSDETLTKCIAELRKAFGDTARDSRVIETIPKLGFRLVPPVDPLAQRAVTEAPTVNDSHSPGQGLQRRFRLVIAVLVAVSFVLGVLLYSESFRSGLNNRAVVSQPKAEQDFAPFYLEQKPGIAVLPFVNMSSDIENEYFSDGMSEEILNALANTDGLPVIARTSSFQFKGDNRDIRDIGRLLGVTHVLEGSVRKSGGLLRVSVQLIDAVTGLHVWSDVYQRELRDIFILQDELTKNIVEQIISVLGDRLIMRSGDPSDANPVVGRRTRNIEAYNLYLTGTQMLASTDPGPIEQAAGYFDQAIALDPEYADAWALKGRSLYVLGRPNYGHSIIPATVHAEAIAAYRKALEIDPRHAFAMGWLGVALMHYEFKWAEGMRLIEQSLALNPNDAALLSVYGAHLEVMKMEGAAQVQDRAFRLDPFGMVPITIRAYNLLQSGRSLDGLAVLETSLIGDRQGYSPNMNAAFFNFVINRVDVALDHINSARKVAHPVDIDLDVAEWAAQYLRGEQAFPWEEIWKRAPTERLSYLVFIGDLVGWESSEAMVKAFDLAIEQRHHELYGVAFGPKPAQMPEADWRRMRDAMGVTAFEKHRDRPRLILSLAN